MQFITPRTMQAALLVALASGCGGRKDPAPEAGPPEITSSYWTNRGVSSTNMWDISFEVIDSGEGGASSMHLGPPGHDPRMRSTGVVFGEVELVLERAWVYNPEAVQTPITLKVNGREYGIVQAKDKVSIDKNRQVFVNRVRRDTAEPPLEPPIEEIEADGK